MSIGNDTQITSPEPPLGVLAYEAPQLNSLGTLADLTRGGDVGSESDGYGDAGASGSV